METFPFQMFNTVEKHGRSATVMLITNTSWKCHKFGSSNKRGWHPRKIVRPFHKTS